MDSIGDLVARDRRRDDTALRAPAARRSYDYRRFCTSAWKTGNLLRRWGVHEGAPVLVADDPAPEPIFAFLGSALLGASTRFGGPEAVSTGDSDPKVVVAPVDEIAEYDVGPGGRRAAYGGPPDDPGIAHFERDAWSENPAFPETAIEPESVAVVAGDGEEFSHAELLAAAMEIAEDWQLEPGDEVAVRASLAEPGSVVAGILAPLLAGAAILLPGGAGSVADFAVAAGSSPESNSIRPDSILR